MNSNDVANSLISFYTKYLGNLTGPLLVFSSTINCDLYFNLLKDLISHDEKSFSGRNFKRLAYTISMYVIFVISLAIEARYHVLKSRNGEWGIMIGFIFSQHAFYLYCSLITHQFGLCISWLYDKYFSLNESLKVLLSILIKRENAKEMNLSRRRKLIEINELSLQTPKITVRKDNKEITRKTLPYYFPWADAQIYPTFSF